MPFQAPLELGLAEALGFTLQAATQQADGTVVLGEARPLIVLDG